MHMVCHMPSLRHLKTKFLAELDFHVCLNLQIKIVLMSLRVQRDKNERSCLKLHGSHHCVFLNIQC